MSDPRPSPSALVVARDVSKTFRTREGNEVHALERVSISVADREIVALLGPSGCGKSTLLKVMGGLYAASAGAIEIAGAPVSDPSRHVGMMFQTPALFPWLTVLENTLLPIRVSTRRRQAVREATERAERFLELVGLSGFERSYPRELSGGMQQRVGICRMLMTDPAVLLMDEPFGSLDEFTREYMDVEMREIVRRERKTAVFVTHSILEAVFIADRVLVMTSRPGRIAGEVSVELETERTSDLFDSEEVLPYVRKARSLLDQNVQDVVPSPLVKDTPSTGSGTSAVER